VQRVFERADKSALLSSIQWLEGDVTEVYTLQDAMQGVEVVYHCAGKVSFNRGDDAALFRINTDGTANVVNEALIAGVKKLCHVSSIATLGRTDGDAPVDEETHWRNSSDNTPYAISKYSGEREVWRGIAEGLPAVIVNPSVIIGAGDWNQSSAKLFRTVDKGLKYYTEGVNGFVDVRDVARCMVLLTESDTVNERFILSSENLSYRELFNTMADALRKPRPNIRVGVILSEIAWRWESVKSLLTGQSSVITRETAKTANSKFFYKNNKLRERLNFSFLPMKQSIHDAAFYYKKENKG
jgi:nucleoside-diphosphate-sugar epimerase